MNSKKEKKRIVKIGGVMIETFWRGFEEGERKEGLIAMHMCCRLRNEIEDNYYYYYYLFLFSFRID